MIKERRVSASYVIHIIIINIFIIVTFVHNNSQLLHCFAHPSYPLQIKASFLLGIKAEHREGLLWVKAWQRPMRRLWWSNKNSGWQGCEKPRCHCEGCTGYVWPSEHNIHDSLRPSPLRWYMLSQAGTFRLITSAEVDHSLPSSSLRTVSCTRLIHHVKPVKPGVIQSRNFVCFCDHCLAGNHQQCDFLDLTGHWITTKIKTQKIECWISDWVSLFHVETVPPPPKPDQIPPPSHNSPLPRACIPPPRQTPPTRSEQLVRQQFFATLLTEMWNAALFQHPTKICIENYAGIANYDLPQEEQYIWDLPVTVDTDSFAILPSVAPEGFLSVTTYADGSCLPRALSAIICGLESLHEEIFGHALLLFLLVLF